VGTKTIVVIALIGLGILGYLYFGGNLPKGAYGGVPGLTAYGGGVNWGGSAPASTTGNIKETAKLPETPKDENKNGANADANTTRSGFGSSWLILLICIPLLLGTGLLSKKVWGTISIFSLTHKIIELTANPPNLAFRNNEATTRITVKFNRKQQQGKPVTLTVTQESGGTAHPTLFRAGELTNGQTTLEVQNTPQEDNVQADLKVIGSEDAIIKVCATVKQRGLGKGPHARITLSKQGLVTNPTIQPAIAQVQTQGGGAITLELTPGGGIIGTGSELDITTKLTPAKTGQIVFTVTNKKGASAGIEPPLADITQRTGEAKTKLKAGPSKGEVIVTASYTTTQNQTITATSKFEIEKRKKEEAGEYTLTLNIPKQGQNTTFETEAEENTLIQCKLTHKGTPVKNKKVEFEEVRIGGNLPPGTRVKPQKATTNEHGVANATFYAGNPKSGKKEDVLLTASYSPSIMKKPIAHASKTITIKPKTSSGNAPEQTKSGWQLPKLFKNDIEKAEEGLKNAKSRVTGLKLDEHYEKELQKQIEAASSAITGMKNAEKAKDNTMRKDFLRDVENNLNEIDAKLDTILIVEAGDNSINVLSQPTRKEGILAVTSNIPRERVIILGISLQNKNKRLSPKKVHLIAEKGGVQPNYTNRTNRKDHYTIALSFADIGTYTAQLHVEHKKRHYSCIVSIEVTQEQINEHTRKKVHEPNKTAANPNINLFATLNHTKGKDSEHDERQSEPADDETKKEGYQQVLIYNAIKDTELTLITGLRNGEKRVPREAYAPITRRNITRKEIATHLTPGLDSPGSKVRSDIYSSQLKVDKGTTKYLLQTTYEEKEYNCLVVISAEEQTKEEVAPKSVPEKDLRGVKIPPTANFPFRVDLKTLFKPLKKTGETTYTLAVEETVFFHVEMPKKYSKIAESSTFQVQNETGTSRKYPCIYYEKGIFFKDRYIYLPLPAKMPSAEDLIFLQKGENTVTIKIGEFEKQIIIVGAWKQDGQKRSNHLKPKD